jgi:hypothetical protein
MDYVSRHIVTALLTYPVFSLEKYISKHINSQDTLLLWSTVKTCYNSQMAEFEISNSIHTISHTRYKIDYKKDQQLWKREISILDRNIWFGCIILAVDLW